MKVTFELDRERKQVYVKRNYADNKDCEPNDISSFFMALLAEIDAVTNGHLQEVVADYVETKAKDKAH